MKAPEPIEIEEAEVERLIEQAQQGRLDAAAQKRIVPLLRTLLWLQRTLLETRISLAKLKKVLFSKRTEKPTRKPQQPPDGSAGSGGDAGGKSDPPSDADLPGAEAGDAREGRQSESETEAETQSGEPTGVGNDGQKLTPRPGHGRLGAADYPGAERALTPILIGHDGDPEDEDQVLMNLALDVPTFFGRFERLCEPVDQEPAVRTAGRERFRSYRDRGYEVHHHQIAL